VRAENTPLFSALPPQEVRRSGQSKKRTSSFYVFPFILSGQVRPGREGVCFRGVFPPLYPLTVCIVGNDCFVEDKELTIPFVSDEVKATALTNTSE
jgi:hypothetical protein